jgi:hypothetical protein
MELAVDDDPGVVTGMSDKTSPDYTNLIPSAKRGKTSLRIQNPPFGVANFDRAEVQLL